jgi:3'-phosphoadenosine 5'-phosphosulfate sulfotransferase (PAPS reductase)/FAD synthetase
MNTAPALRLLSLGAGVQSTTLLLLAAEGRIPKPDYAIFADTGWEPATVYAHLDRLDREVAQPAGIPIHRVRVSGGTEHRVSGDLRADSLNPGSFVRIPVFVMDRAGNGAAMVRRQCTEEYKVKPIKEEVRRLFGYPHPRPVPRGMYAEQAIGISRDEFHRAKDAQVQYLRNVFPLLDLDGAADGREGWTRNDCMRYLRANGWGETPKSACIGCPFHGNRQWRDLRDNHPEEWADAVDFDHQLRKTQLRGIKEAPYLHRSLKPLDEAPIDRVTRNEWSDRQVDLFDAVADAELDLLEEGAPDACSPWACRSGEPVTEETAR